MDAYLTVRGEGGSEYIEKRSRFLGRALPCDSEERAVEIINETKSRYWDARHNVYAYLLRGGTARFSDDGEPHGTAGRPVLDVLKGSGMCDTLIIVTRYFGGVLLGTGGLVRAYSSAARDALEDAGCVEMCPCLEYSVSCGYAEHSRLLSLIERCGGTLKGSEFTEGVRVIFTLKSGDSGQFSDALRESFSATLTAEQIGENYCAVEIER